MTIKTGVISFLVAVMFCAVAGSAQVRRTVTKIDSFDFGSGGSVSITGAPKGSIRVTGSTKNEVQITAEMTFEASTEAELDQIVAISGFAVDEGTALLNIVTVGPYNKFRAKKLPKTLPKGLFTAQMTANYVISVPKYCDLQIDGGIGDLVIKGVEGSLRANFLESNAVVELIGGESTLLIGLGSADVTFGSKGWRGRAADMQVAKGDLTVRLPTTLSGEVEAVVLRTGQIENTYPNLKPRNRKVPFTDKSMAALAGVGGSKLKFTVGDGVLKIMPLTAQ